MDAPSGGAVWPVTLRRKLGLPPSANNASSTSKKSDSEEGNHSPHQHKTKLSTHQLRNYIHSSYAALTSIQRQLHRGEESYFEETYAHGNLFSGWDNIWIENPNSGSHGINTTLVDGGSANASLSSSGGVNSNNSGGNNPPVVKHISTRKMPNDFRWFSSSSGSVLATGEGKIAELGRPSLMDRPPTPEIKEEEAKKKIVVSSSDKPTVGADTTTDTAAEEQPTEKMEVDVVNDDSNTKSHVKQEQTEDAASPTRDAVSTKEEKQVPSQEEKKFKVEEDVKNDPSSSSVDPIAEAKNSNAQVAVSAVPPPTDQAAQPVKTESKNDEDVSNEEQKDETTKDAEKESNNKEEQPATDKVEDEDVEMKTEVEPSEPISNPPEPPTKETSEGLTEEEPSTKEQSLSQSTTVETQQPAKVPKLSVHDTPNRAAKLATENSVTKEDKNAKPVEKAAIAEKAKEATEKEDDKDTKAKTEPKAKAARPARRTTRRTTRKRKS